jgi:hypothetical protein
MFIFKNISVGSSDRVQVEFFVMSKCPDAMKCELLFSPSLLRLSSIVNFNLSFIGVEGRLNEFRCMHGPEECIGNKQQLCVQNMYSHPTFIRFIQCQSNQLLAIPKNGETCARQNHIRWSDVQSCVTSNKGNELFRRSLERTRLAAATKSCTIHLNGQFWCMHDGYWLKCSEGHDERSFIRAICSRYNGKNKPVECAAFG